MVNSSRLCVRAKFASPIKKVLHQKHFGIIFNNFATVVKFTAVKIYSL